MLGVKAMMRVSSKLGRGERRVVDKVSWTRGIYHPFRYHQVVPVPRTVLNESLRCEGHLKLENRP